MKATWKGVVVAESEDIVEVEGNAYFPRSSLSADHFESSDHTSHCGWKGAASYLDIVVDGERNANAAWLYAEPLSAAEKIRGRVAFWKGVVVS